MTDVAASLRTGLRCRCPACGQAPLFASFLRIHDQCPACAADLSIAETADGPAFFVMFAVMILLAPIAMLTELAMNPPIWIHALLWPPVVLVLCMALLRPVKSLLFALQWANDAHEAVLDEKKPLQ